MVFNAGTYYLALYLQVCTQRISTVRVLTSSLVSKELFSPKGGLGNAALLPRLIHGVYAEYVLCDLSSARAPI